MAKKGKTPGPKALKRVAGGTKPEPHVTSAHSFDANKAEHIKAPISSGTFVTHSESTADKLIASVRDLLGKK